ncbi:hypothetical protein HDU85_004655 [Gaertneriomyces sp. JEL0708]|nr:hypothetical protein HDU85_004655 [Gaertneriomyces sp. JEL0708]
MTTNFLTDSLTDLHRNLFPGFEVEGVSKEGFQFSSATTVKRSRRAVRKAIKNDTSGGTQQPVRAENEIPPDIVTPNAEQTEAVEDRNDSDEGIAKPTRKRIALPSVNRQLLKPRRRARHTPTIHRNLASLKDDIQHLRQRMRKNIHPHRQHSLFQIQMSRDKRVLQILDRIRSEEAWEERRLLERAQMRKWRERERAWNAEGYVQVWGHGLRRSRIKKLEKAPVGSAMRVDSKSPTSDRISIIENSISDGASPTTNASPPVDDQSMSLSVDALLSQHEREREAGSTVSTRKVCTPPPLPPPPKPMPTLNRTHAVHQSIFITFPKVIRFIIPSGKEQKAVVTITNSSPSPATFKLISLPAALQDIIEVQYEPPGRLFAGQSHEVGLVFNPASVRGPGEASIRFLSDCGKTIQVPIHWSTESCKPQISGAWGEKDEFIKPENPYGDTEYPVVTRLATITSATEMEIDFPATVPSGKRVRRVDVMNRGGVSGQFTIETEGDEDAFGIINVHPSADLLEPNGTVSLWIAFTPDATNARHLAGTFTLHFADATVAPVIIRCNGSVKQIPITVDEEADLGVCVVGGKYRAAIVVANAGNMGVKGWIETVGDSPAVSVSSSLASITKQEKDKQTIRLPLGQLHLAPANFHVPPHQNLSILFHFRPSLAAYHDLNNDEDRGFFTIPLRVGYEVDGTYAYGDVLLRGRISIMDVDLTISPTQTPNFEDYLVLVETTSPASRVRSFNLALGDVSIDTAAPSIPVRLHNRSLIPQTFHYSTTSPNLQIGKEHKGSLTIAAGSTFELAMKVTFDQIGPISAFLELEPENRRPHPTQPSIHIKITAHIVRPRLKFSVSHSTVSFSPTALGTSSTQTVEIHRPLTWEEKQRRKQHNVKRKIHDQRPSVVPSSSSLPALVYAATDDPRKKEQTIEFELGEPQQVSVNHANLVPYLTLSRMRGQLLPGQSLPIHLTFAPPLPAPSPDGRVPSAASSAADTERGSKATSPPASTASSTSKVKIEKKKDRKKSRGVTPITPGLPEAPEVVPTMVEEPKEETKPATPQKTDLEERLEGIEESTVVSRIPCLISLSEQQAGDSEGHRMDTIYLTAEIPLQKPDVILLNPPALDFGNVPLSHAHVLAVHVRNISSTRVEVYPMNFTPNTGQIAFLHAPPFTVGPRQDLAIEVAFTPVEVHKMVHELCTLQTPKTRINFAVQGRGFEPRLELSNYETLQKTGIAFGDLLLTNSATRTLELKNVTDYPITASLDIPNPLFDDENPFTTPASTFMLNPMASVQFDITFAPRHESDNLFTYLQVNTWGLPSPVFAVKLWGRCWDTTTALLGYDQFPESICQGPFDMPPELFLNADDRSLEPSVASSRRESLFAVEGEDEVVFTPSTTPSEAFEPPLSLSEQLSSTYPKDPDAPRYATLKCHWHAPTTAVPLYALHLPTLSLTNILPPTPENQGQPATQPSGKQKKKRTGLSVPADFVIDPFEGSFAYSDQVNLFLPSEIAPAPFPITISPTEGTLEPAATLALTISPPRPRTPSAAGKRRSSRAKATEQDSPITAQEPTAFEAYFRITVNGGVKIVDKDTLTPAMENRVWVVKIWADDTVVPAEHCER